MRYLIASVFLSFGVVPVVAQTAFSDSVSAILEPVQKVEIRTAVNGRVEALPMPEGQVANSGDILVVIDANVQKARVDFAKISAESEGGLLRAQTVLAQAVALRDRVLSAREKGAAQAWEVKQSEQAVALAQADLVLAREARDQAEAQLDLELATLSEFSIRAPFPATILQTLVEPGEIVDTQAVIMEIGNLDRLKATAFFPVDWIEDLSAGQSVSATLDDAGNPSVELEVTRIGQRIDPASRTVRVVLELDNAETAILAGTSVIVEMP